MGKVQNVDSSGAKTGQPESDERQTMGLFDPNGGDAAINQNMDDGAPKDF